MADYQTICRVEELPAGTSRTALIAGKLVAVFHHAGGYFAIDDVCPHMGASLAEGDVEHGIVTCPWHGWRFRLADGAWMGNPRIKIGCFPVLVVDGQIQVQVGGSAQPAACMPGPS
jgi:nitrite reductase (NADH) small subunit/3-phenylpropionate/trans-cinnamate dioxygenase ferredoxin subunit